MTLHTSERLNHSLAAAWLSQTAGKHLQRRFPRTGRCAASAFALDLQLPTCGPSAIMPRGDMPVAMGVKLGPYEILAPADRQGE